MIKAEQSKKNLLLIAAGKNSLHQHWHASKDELNFDFVILNYADTDFLDAFSKTALVNFKSSGSKWGMVKEFFKTHEGLMSYSQFLVMDDDLETCPCDIEKLFTTTEKYGFELSHPSITGYTTFLSILPVTGSLYHLTNITEIMATVLSKKLMHRTLEFLDEVDVKHGWGLDVFWNKFLCVNKGITRFGTKVGFIDEVSMIHTRPVGGGSALYSTFGNPADAKKELLLKIKSKSLNCYTEKIFFAPYASRKTVWLYSVKNYFDNAFSFLRVINFPFKKFFSKRIRT